jgi:predicted nucleic acid-binding protein
VILYLDASALVKRYIAEPGSAEVDQLIAQAEGIGTSIISRAEVAAALAESVHIGFLSREEASAALQVFRAQWVDLVRLQLTEVIIARADALAWEHGLRGYDAVHLAAALFWQETMSEPVTLATFDHQLWQAGIAAGVTAWPTNLEQFKRNV